MKQILPIFVLIACILNSACNKDDYSSYRDIFSKREYGETLRILAIGNSFSNDSMEYIPDILNNLGIKNVELARISVDGCTLQYHKHLYDNNNERYLLYTSPTGINNWIKNDKEVSIKQVLAMGEWDIITIQQASGVSGIYDSYTPHLKHLIKAIKDIQPQAELVWHMTWSYSTNCTHNEYYKYDFNQLKMFNAITACTLHLMKDHKEIQRIIPSGTAIQSLRQSPINNPPKDLTRDGYHIDLGVGRYTLACTWYEVLIYPYTRISMMGNGVRLKIGDIAVTDAIALYCQKAAKQATLYPFNIQNIE